MSSVGIQLFGIHTNVPEPSCRTQEVLIRSRDPMRTRLSAMWQMITLIVFSILNCLAYLASAVVKGLLVYGSIEHFQQQKANAGESFICCVFGICLLAKIAFQGVVRAQEPEVERQQQSRAKFAEELKAILESQIESQLQAQCQHRLKECILYLFPSPLHQECLQNQLQKWLQSITELSKILYDDSEDTGLSTEGSLCDSALASFRQKYPQNDRGAMRDLFAEWIEGRLLAILRDGFSPNWCQAISRKFLGGSSQEVHYLIPRNLDCRQSSYCKVLTEYLGKSLLEDCFFEGSSSTLHESMFRALILDFVLSQLHGREKQLEELIPEISLAQQLQEIGNELCLSAYQKMLERLCVDAKETMESGRARRLRAIKCPFADWDESIGGWFSAAPLPFQYGCTKEDPVYQELVAHFKRKQIEIQSKVQPWVEARLLGAIQAAFPDFTEKKQKNLQMQLQKVFRTLGSKLHELLGSRQACWEEPPFQELGKDERKAFRYVLWHGVRERFCILLQDQLQDLHQIWLSDQSRKRLRYTFQGTLSRGYGNYLEKTALDVVLREGGWLREWCIQDFCLDLLPKLLEDRSDLCQTIAGRDPSHQWEIRDYQDQRELKDYFQALILRRCSRVPMFKEDPISEQLAKILEGALLGLRDDSCSHSLSPSQMGRAPLPPTAPPKEGKDSPPPYTSLYPPHDDSCSHSLSPPQMGRAPLPPTAPPKEGKDSPPPYSLYPPLGPVQEIEGC